MNGRVKTSVMQATLQRLGFVPYRTVDNFPAFEHEKSGTIHIFPKDGRRALGAGKVWSIRYITIGRGAATERAYDKAFVEASATKPARPAKPKAVAKPARRRVAAGAVA